MSNLFAHLPHLLGSISNLTGSQSRRAMTALKSENTRRQEIFAKCGVNNISDYIRLYERGEAKEPLPHIILTVDEFAELKSREPEFMESLISISQVGRSLGIHLLLATQKPAGVIDDKIRSNTGFRIALRLVDRADSMDLLKRGDAAFLKECGRAILQVGNDEVFECFQSGYAMTPVGSGTDPPRIFTDFLMDEEVLCRQPGTALGDDPGGGYEDSPKVYDREEEPSWFELVMCSLSHANKGRKKAPSKLWLPPLPENITDDKAFAVFDDPCRQRYVRAFYEPERTGHVIVCGRSGSGKSELLTTIILSFAMRYPPDKLSFVLIDYKGRKRVKTRTFKVL